MGRQTSATRWTLRVSAACASRIKKTVHRRATASPFSGLGQGLIDIPNDVAKGLQSNGKADQVGRHASGNLLLFGQLTVGGGGRVYDQGLGVADVGQVRDKLDAVDECFPGARTSLNGERTGPKVRKPSMRHFMVKPKSPKVSKKRTPW